MKKAMKVLNEKLGILVQDKKKNLESLLMQIRRFSQINSSFQSLPVKIMTAPITINKDEFAAKALSIMNNKKITSLIVNKENRLNQLL